MLSHPISNRRDFLRHLSAGALVTVGGGPLASPLWATASARARREDHGRVLVVVQLSGGNDGLNTIIPYADDIYQRNRLTLGHDAPSVLKIDEYLGWHPSARGLADLMQSGDLSVVQGVGYPNPNRSHFESMDLWHTAHSHGRGTGWLGRFADRLPRNQTPSTVYVGRGVRPLALQARDAVPLTLRALDQFRFPGGEQTKDLAEELSDVAVTDDGLLSMVSQNMRAALHADRQLAAAVRYQKSSLNQLGPLGRDLGQVATMIRAELPATVYYVTLDGFDTHANQRQAHASLLDQLGTALKAFCDELREASLLDRVLVMAFSEFGRRVKENGSQGTDHGVAGPLLLAGAKPFREPLHRSGPQPLIGAHPDLADLIDGDLKHSIDYRSVYRTVLTRWLQTQSDDLIEGQFPLLGET